MDSRRRGSIADVHNALAGHIPHYRVDSVVSLGEGLDNLTYEVNGELIVRFAKEPDPTRLTDEARLLAAVAGVSPLPVPEPIFTATELGCLAYRRLRGVPLLEIPHHLRSGHGPAISATLGQLLAALHAVPVDRWIGLVGTDELPLSEWIREAVRTYPMVIEGIPAVHRRPIEAFLEASPPSDEYVAVFSHNDLGIEHVLVDPVDWTVTGIIDWSDAAIADPARDFGLLHRDLGPTALHAALRRYRTDTNDIATLVERAAFYARCTLLEDLAFGIETGRDEYVDKCLVSMAWLFPA